MQIPDPPQADRAHQVSSEQSAFVSHGSLPDEVVELIVLVVAPPEPPTAAPPPSLVGRGSIDATLPHPTTPTSHHHHRALMTWMMGSRVPKVDAHDDADRDEGPDGTRWCHNGRKRRAAPSSRERPP